MLDQNEQHLTPSKKILSNIKKALLIRSKLKKISSKHLLKLPYRKKATKPCNMKTQVKNQDKKSLEALAKSSRVSIKLNRLKFRSPSDLNTRST